MARRARLVTIGPARHRFSCHVCQGQEFFDREVKVNSSGAEFLGMGWADQSATGLVCARCGYLHMFVDASLELWSPQDGYPDQAATEGE